MVMQKRWFIREGTDIKKFAKAMKACKDFTPQRQKEMLKLIFACKLDRFIAAGVKKKLARKKVVKKELALHKEDLAFQMLDMMEEKWVDITINKEQDRENSKKAFEAIERIADGKHDKELKEMENGTSGTDTEERREDNGSTKPDLGT